MFSSVGLAWQGNYNVLSLGLTFATIVAGVYKSLGCSVSVNKVYIFQMHFR